jgi:hypothetical protein
MERNSHTDSTRSAAEYDPETGTYVVDYHETSDVELSVTVVHAVLAATGAEAMEANLNDVIHPDALNRLFADTHDGRPRTGGTLTFEFAGCRVTVEGGGEVRVDPSP